MLRTVLRHEIAKTVESLWRGIELLRFDVTSPSGSEHGDWATNAAFALARELKKSPHEIAGALAGALEKNPRVRELCSAVEAAAGFVNFTASERALADELSEVTERGARYGRLVCERPLSYNIEFISANPTGPLTVGNGRGAFVGDALANALLWAGHRVVREYYINDARESAQVRELGKAVLGRGESYPGPYTDEIRTRLQKKYFSFGKMDERTAGFAAAREIQRDNKAFVSKKLKIKFDVWYSEETLYKKRLVAKTVASLMRSGSLYEKDGATWFRASQFGDAEDRVAVRTDGAPTYFVPDTAYHHEKLASRKFDRVIDILGADHHGTFPRVLAGLAALGDDPARIAAIFLQIVRLVRGGEEVKVSKRRGTYVTLEELVDEVGLDAARYFFLERSPETHMNFDLDMAREQSMKNPVYYLQYAYVRCESILRKVKSQKSRVKSKEIDLIKLLATPEERALVKKLIRFPETIEDAAAERAPARLVHYGQELARIVHAFYEKHRVITDDERLTAARVELVRATAIVFKNLFSVIGIGAPKKM